MDVKAFLPKPARPVHVNEGRRSDDIVGAGMTPTSTVLSKLGRTGVRPYHVIHTRVVKVPVVYVVIAVVAYVASAVDVGPTTPRERELVGLVETVVRLPMRSRMVPKMASNQPV